MATPQTTKPALTQSAVQAQNPLNRDVYFSYFGNTGLTVLGPVSSRVYRFLTNGGPIAVDPRDAASLARVPNLKRIPHL